MRELVSGTDDEPVECVPVVQRTEHRPGARGGLLGELQPPGRHGNPGKRVLLLAPDHDLDGDLLRQLLPRDLLDSGEVVLLDPLLEELVRRGDEDDRAFPRDEPQGAQPRLEHLFAHLAAQLGEDFFPRFRGHAAVILQKGRPGRKVSEKRSFSGREAERMRNSCQHVFPQVWITFISFSFRVISAYFLWVSHRYSLDLVGWVSASG